MIVHPCHTRPPLAWGVIGCGTNRGWRLEKGGFKLSRSSWPRSTLLLPPSWTECPLLRTDLFPITCIAQPPSVRFSIFLCEMNVIFWSTQVSLVFLSEGIKARGEESVAESGFLLMPGEKDKSSQGRRGGKESGTWRGNSLPHLIES